MDDSNKMVEIVCRKIDEVLQERDTLLLAIDGRCGSGKTTLAARLREIMQCQVIHMDHFFPRLAQRTPERLSEPGGNVDRERFLEEVMVPLKRREVFSYCPYDPRKHEMAAAIQIEPGNVVIIEGSYSCHPALFDHYDMRIFLTVDEPERLRRIKHRNGEAVLIQFQEKWIPMEERYFSVYNIEERCDFRFKTG